MKYAIFLFFCFLIAVPARADSGSVAEWNVGGTISFTNGTVTQSIVFDAQYLLTSNGPFDVTSTEVGQPYEVSTGPLGDFGGVFLVTNGPTYLAFFDPAGDEVDLFFASQFSTDLSGPAGAYVWGCKSQACLDNFSIDGLTEGILYPAKFDGSITQVPVAEPGEAGMLLLGLVVILALTRKQDVLAA